MLRKLVGPRGEGEPGRYQSPELSPAQFQKFLAVYAELLCKDARFDIWAYSQLDRATVVWDRHNRIYAYGNLQGYETELRAIGFEPGFVPVPSPHEHSYRNELDPLAASLLQSYEWIYSPLKPEDEQ